MRFRRPKIDAPHLPMLRPPKRDYRISPVAVAGDVPKVERRLDEFLTMFREQGARLTNLRDPLCAVAVGAALNAPFASIAELHGSAAGVVFDAVAAEKTPDALAALLALAAATDGEIEARAGTAAARMGRRLPKPPWAAPARQPVGTPLFELLADRDDDDNRGLLVTFDLGKFSASFFMRFYRGSVITENITFLPEVKRRTLLAELERGSQLTGPYNYVPRTTIGEQDQVDVVEAILQANQDNLLMGAEQYPYPLAAVASLRQVNVVPALLVLLRKLQGAAAGLTEWPADPGHPTLWR